MCFAAIESLIWDAAEPKRVTSLDEQHIRQWDASTLQSTTTIDGSELDKFEAACVIPYKGNQVAVASNEAVKVYDLSSKKYVLTCPLMHSRPR